MIRKLIDLLTKLESSLPEGAVVFLEGSVDAHLTKSSCEFLRVEFDSTSIEIDVWPCDEKGWPLNPVEFSDIEEATTYWKGE